MDVYLGSFCRNIKADILRSRHKEAIATSEKIVEREASNFKELSRNTFIYFLYLESYCCHKTILKSLMEQDLHINALALEASTRIMLRNLKAIYISIQQYLQNRQVIVNFGSFDKKQVCVSFAQQNTTDVSQKSFTNFIQISTWLIKDQILLLNLQTNDHAKSDIFQIAIKFLHLVAETIKRKKIRFRVNQLEIKCQFVVFLFRMKEYSKGSKLTQKTITQIYEFLFYLTHKKDKSSSQRAGRYKKAIKKCYKLLLVVLIYQAFFHVVSDSIHPLQALLSIIKKIETIPGPKEMIKYYQGYRQIFNQLLLCTITHDQFYQRFKGEQIFSIRQIFSLCQVREKIKATNENAISNQFQFDSSIKKSCNFTRRKRSLKQKIIVPQLTESKGAEAPKSVQDKAKSKFSKGTDQICESQFFSRTTITQKRQNPTYSQNRIGLKSGASPASDADEDKVLQKYDIWHRAGQRTLRLSDLSLESKILNGKRELGRKKCYEVGQLVDWRYTEDKSDMKHLKNEPNRAKYLAVGNMSKNKQNQAMRTGYHTLSVYDHTKWKKSELQGHQQMGNRQKQKPIKDKFIELLVKNKSSLSILALANRLELYLKKQQNKRNKDKQQMKMLKDNFIGDIFWQNNQTTKFRNTFSEFQSVKANFRNYGKLKISKMKSENLQVAQKRNRQDVEVDKKYQGQAGSPQKQENKKLKNIKKYSKNTQSRNHHACVNFDLNIRDQLNDDYEQKLRICFEKSRESIDDVSNKILKKSQNFRRTKDRNIKKSQTFFRFQSKEYGQLKLF